MPERNNMLKSIKEGMKVYDNKGEEVGTVEFVRFSEMNGSQFSSAASLPDERTSQNLVETVAKPFGSDDLPKELRERLLMHGFIRIDSAGLFGADRYVISDQIAAVERDAVHLKVADVEELVIDK